MISLIFQIDGKTISKLDLSDTEAYRASEILFAHSKEWMSNNDLKASMMGSELERCVRIERRETDVVCTGHKV